MSTALATKSAGGGMMISRDALRQSLGNVAKEMPRVKTGGVDFLSMDKGGDWTYGLDGTEVSPDSLWAINPATLEHGWIAWGEELGNAPLGEIMVSAMRPLPDVNGLPQVDEGKGYQKQYSVELLCIAGPDEGAHVLYKKESVGAIKLFNKYIDELSNRVEGESDELVAIVQITSESYIHKQFKKTFNPIFEYVEWRTPDDTSTPEVAAAEEKVEEKKPATARTRKPAAEKPKVEEPVEDEQEVDEQEDEQEVDGEESEEDRLIAELLAKKEAKRKAAEAPAEEKTEDTPRRRARR